MQALSVDGQPLSIADVESVARGGARVELGARGRQRLASSREALHAAIEQAQGETAKPSLIILKTIIGWPAPKKQGTGKIHGSKLGGEEVAALKEVLGFDPEQSFQVDDAVLEYTRGNAAERAYLARRRDELAE